MNKQANIFILMSNGLLKELIGQLNINKDEFEPLLYNKIYGKTLDLIYDGDILLENEYTIKDEEKLNDIKIYVKEIDNLISNIQIVCNNYLFSICLSIFLKKKYEIYGNTYTFINYTKMMYIMLSSYTPHLQPLKKKYKPTLDVLYEFSGKKSKRKSKRKSRKKSKRKSKIKSRRKSRKKSKRKSRKKSKRKSRKK